MTKQKENVVKQDVKSFDYDAVIIGTGPGGEAAALRNSEELVKHHNAITPTLCAMSVVYVLAHGFF